MGFGHTFIGTYLNVEGAGIVGDGSEHSPKIIAQAVKSAHLNLLKTNPCGKYDFIRIGFLHTRLISVVGRISGTNKDESIGYLPIASTKAVNGKCPGGYVPFGWEEDFVSVYDNNTWYTEEWKLGFIHNIEELESKKGATLNFFANDRCYNVSLSNELYDLAESAFTGNELDSETDPTQLPIYMYRN